MVLHVRISLTCQESWNICNVLGNMFSCSENYLYSLYNIFIS